MTHRGILKRLLIILSRTSIWYLNVNNISIKTNISTNIFIVIIFANKCTVKNHYNNTNIIYVT